MALQSKLRELLMKTILAFAIAIIATSVVVAPAQAGNKVLKAADGSKIKIACRNSGCSVKKKAAGAKKYVEIEETEGGTKNFKKLVAKYSN